MDSQELFDLGLKIGKQEAEIRQLLNDKARLASENDVLRCHLQHFKGVCGYHIGHDGIAYHEQLCDKHWGEVAE